MDLPDVKEVKGTTDFRRVVFSDRSFRPVMRAAPFGHIRGALPPTPDITDSPTLLAGAMKRFLFAPPEPDVELMERFGLFVKDWIAENLTPLAPTTDVSFDHWVENINHPQSRREELKTLWNSLSRKLDPAKHATVKQFMKDESYDSYKHGRAINSRHDAFKCATGPFFHAIEQVLFKLKWFIKYVRVPDRPDLIFDRLFRQGAKYYSSDFTSFESLFTPEFMLKCEYQLYDYMSQHLPNRDLFMSCVDMIVGKNKIEGKWFGVDVQGTRMSGEMNTSLGNGFSNLMMWLFLCHENGAECDGFVEGDDGLFRVDGVPPTAEQFAKLGMVIKLEEHEQLNLASFCGNVFDLRIRTQITEPTYAATNLFWIGGKYAFSGDTLQRTLLRSKALSLAYQYPAHPILSALADRVMYLTRSLDVRRVLKQGFFDEWTRAQLKEALEDYTPGSRSVPIENRLLVEGLYGITPDQQIAFEQKVASWELGQPLDLTWDVPETWAHYYDRYVTTTRRRHATQPGFWPSNHMVNLPVRPTFSDHDTSKWEELFTFGTLS